MYIVWIDNNSWKDSHCHLLEDAWCGRHTRLQMIEFQEAFVCVYDHILPRLLLELHLLVSLAHV